MVVAGSTVAPVSRATRVALKELADDVEFSCPYLRDPRLMPWTDSLTLAVDSGVAWLYGPAERDPLRGRRGRTVLPRAGRSRLARIAAYRVPFRAVTIAHELDPLGPVRDLLPELTLGPRPCSDATARWLVGALPAHPTVTRALHLLDQAVSGATSSAQASVRLLERTLDPVVFGVVAPEPLRPGAPSLWYPLTAWRW